MSEDAEPRQSGADPADDDAQRVVAEGPAVLDREPLLKVVKGRPTDEELAALVAVLAARGSSTGAPPQTRASGWTDRARLVGAPLRPGPDAWRARTH